MTARQAMPENLDKSIVRAMRLAFVAILAMPLLSNCDENGRRESALREASAACGTAAVIMPGNLEGDTSMIFVKVFFRATDPRFHCLKTFTSKAGYKFHPISFGDSPEHPE